MSRANPRNIRQVISTFLLIGTVIWNGCRCESSSQSSPSPFVQTDGTQFILNGRPYRYVGINFWHAAYLGADIIPNGQARLKRELDLLKAHGVTNLRITAAAESSAISRSVRPAFQTAPGQYNEMLLKGLDRVLDEMAKREMKAVLVMGNYWEWSGGMAQYVSWTTKTPVIDPAVNDQGTRFMAYAAQFYEMKKAWRPYMAYLTHVISRTNTVNRVSYRDDPTIMSWQLANEPRPHPKGRAEPTKTAPFFKWITATAEAIHSLAPQHLVSTGNEGTVGCLDNEKNYIRAHNSDSIDYATVHIWPKNWNWYIPNNTEKTLESAIRKTQSYLSTHIRLAEKLNKPTVLEEFGLSRDDESTDPDHPVTARNTYLKQIFNQVETQQKKKGPLAGTNIWSWGGEGRAHTDDAVWQPETDFTGDPPQEPQGLNSIFDSDADTLTIIKQHAAHLHNSLSKN